MGHNLFGGLRLAFLGGMGKVVDMKLMANVYWWRFTYRSNRLRGAIV
jgi:hypothetical protein